MMLKTKALPSLRSRYLSLAISITAVLLIGASTAHWYIFQASQSNEHSLSINYAINEAITETRRLLTGINTAVNTMLIRPDVGHEAYIQDNIKLLDAHLNNLTANKEFKSAKLSQQLTHLHQLITELNSKILYLIEQRKNTDWVYPMLPYINNKLLTPNVNFIAAINQAIAEYRDDDLAIDETYHQLQTLRYLWQDQILNFRAVIVRFAGLNNPERIQQVNEIEVLQNEIQNIIGSLKIKSSQANLNLITEAALPILMQTSKDWYAFWLELKSIKNSKYWRGDIKYLNTYITPLQNRTESSLSELEKTILDQTNEQSTILSSTAKNIIIELWILILLAVCFVIFVYLLIEKLVLKPIQRISQSIIEEGQEQFFQLDDSSSQEIYNLSSSFNDMRKQIHQRQVSLEHQALHDALTGLPNRVLLDDRLTQAISIMKRSNDKLAVLLLDLDRFKEVNDTLGHHMGDILLQLVSARIQKVTRNSDTSARLGGDEFCLLAPNTNAEEAYLLAEKIIDSLKDVFTVEDQNIFVGASIGISIYPDHGIDSHTLLRHADTAMYVAKENNQGALLYRSDLDHNTADNLSLAGELHAAINNKDGLALHYQPQVNLLTNSVSQVEALLRWRHPKKGYIPAEQIIKLAEQTGLIIELTAWVLETAISDYISFLEKRDIRLSVNLSALNLQDPKLTQTLDTLLTKFNMPANMLTLEITETAMMIDPVRARKVLSELNDRNISLSIDDYGTGFSSLSYLKLLPVDELKIDKSFIFDMLEDENDAIIVRSTIELAHNLGYQVIAEGVENLETKLQLRSLKCDFIQGYYLSKPIDILQLVVWMNNYQPQSA